MKCGRFILLILGALLLGGCTGSTSSQKTFKPNPAQMRLAELIVQRLEVGRQVAWIKYVNEMAVKDPEREALVLASLTEQASQLGVSPEITKDFFQAQIIASRRLQEQLIHKWKRGASLPTYPPRDLRRDIRPRMDYLGTELLKELRVVRLPDAELAKYTEAQIEQRGFAGLVARQATAPLR